MDILKLIWPALPEIEGIETDLARMEDAGSTDIISIFSQVFDLL